MDRERLLARIDVANGRGLEIGALTHPVVTRAMGRVEYVDRAPTAELARWYENQGHVDAADLVAVDHVWGDQTLLDCVGGERRYDYVVASHVIEHVPDLFGWLCEIASVLVDGGIASFAVPDKRYTYDYFRRTSSGSELVDAFVRRLRKPDARQIFDHFSAFRNIDSAAINAGLAPETVPPAYNIRGVYEVCERAAANGEYIDTYCWVFTPRSFVDLIDLGTRLFLVPFEIAALFPTAEGSHEFHVSLRRLPEAMRIEDRRDAFLASRQRLDLPAEIEPEQAALLRRAEAAERRIAELGRQLDASASQLSTMADRLSSSALQMDLLEQRLSAMHRSTSWRITAPLRRLASLWRNSVHVR